MEKMKHIEIYGDNYIGHYALTRIGCRGIVIDNDKILVSYETKTNQYMIPGGGLENNESEIECVIREIKEETGYIVKASDCKLEIDEYYGNEKFINKYYLCRVIEKVEPSLTDREKEVGMEPRWINVKDLISIFSKHQDYAENDEMRRGLYFREYTALKIIIQEE